MFKINVELKKLMIKNAVSTDFYLFTENDYETFSILALNKTYLYGSMYPSFLSVMEKPDENGVRDGHIMVFDANQIELDVINIDIIEKIKELPVRYSYKWIYEVKNGKLDASKTSFENEDFTSILDGDLFKMLTDPMTIRYRSLINIDDQSDWFFEEFNKKNELLKRLVKDASSDYMDMDYATPNLNPMLMKNIEFTGSDFTKHYLTYGTNDGDFEILSFGGKAKVNDVEVPYVVSSEYTIKEDSIFADGVKFISNVELTCYRVRIILCANDKHLDIIPLFNNINAQDGLPVDKLVINGKNVFYTVDTYYNNDTSLAPIEADDIEIFVNTDMTFKLISDVLKGENVDIKSFDAVGPGEIGKIGDVHVK